MVKRQQNVYPPPILPHCFEFVCIEDNVHGHLNANDTPPHPSQSVPLPDRPFAESRRFQEP